jgi:hypothetical protein|tara:strand:+ start:308 stop:751 length:444 start_codon:yes stop_codon:yes gene_type:complete
MKNNKTLLYGALLGTGLYLYLRMKKNKVVGSTGSTTSTTTDETVVEESVGLSEKDKNNLFTATLGYQGGARPSREMEERFRKASLEAKAKIEELGLIEEFKAWKIKRKKERRGGSQGYPQYALPTGMDKYSGGGTRVPMSTIPLTLR